MKTDSLENSIRILDFLSNLDEEYRQGLIKELSHPDLDIMTNFIEPFSSELNENLLHKESQDGLKIVIRHYIDAFLRIVPHFTSSQNILLENNEILNEFSDYGIPLVLEGSDLSDYSKYVILSYYIFDWHFYDIQTCCLKYNLDFFKFCREIHLDCSLIDTKVTVDYMKTEAFIQNKNNMVDKLNVPEDHNTIKSFPEYLIHENRELLAEKIKSEFNTEKGKAIRLMIEALIEAQILILGNREKTSLYKSLQIYFDREIGSKQSIFDYQFNPELDEREYEGFKKRIDFLLTNIDKKNETPC